MCGAWVAHDSIDGAIAIATLDTPMVDEAEDFVAPLALAAGWVPVASGVADEPIAQIHCDGLCMELSLIHI